MNAVLLEQTASHLTRQTLRWDRRLRLATSLLWVPRALMVGLLIGVAVALVSRLRAWLLPEQIALVAAVAVAVAGIGSVALIWLWPRSTTHQARYFDRRFGLKERISTALELVGGTIPLPDHLAERQLSDAVNAARRVDLVSRLPLRIRWMEIVAVIALAGLLAYLLSADNPHNDELRAQRELENAIDSQVANLDETIASIEQNPSLSEEEKEALTQPLEEAREILQQQNVTQEEAVAALAEASQSLSDMSDGLRPDQKAAYEQAASQLAGSDMTRDLAEALKEPNLAETAEAMDDLAERLGEEELSEEEREELASALERAADELQASNPALAEKLREAAQALREGDIEAAQQALREAAEIAREQSEDLETSPMAQAAQQAEQETNEDQRELAQAGQESSGLTQPSQREPTREGDNPPEGLEPQAQDGQSAPADSQQGNELQESEFTTGEQGEQSQPGEGQQPGQIPQSEGQMQQGDSTGGDPGEGEGQSESSESSETGDQAGEAGEGAQPSQSQSSEGAQNQQDSALSAGSGEGGAGAEDVTGTQIEGSGEGGEISTDNSPQDAGIEDFDPVYDPFNIGGESSATVDIGGDAQGDEGQTVQQGEFGPNPEGVSTLSYSGVFGRYQGIVSDALESGRIPLDQRDVIHDYFSSLER